MAHKTALSLNDNLRLGRLSVPQWAAVVVGALSLWLWSSIFGTVRDPNTHILAVTVPTLLTVVPLLVFGRGGQERYPHQLARYSLRRGLVYGGRALAVAHLYAQKGIHYAAVTLRQREARRRQRRA